MKQGVCVLGSLNVDLVVRLPRFHQPGETILAGGFSTFPGGKGGNQAVAAARLGEKVRMVACVGDDDNGRSYLHTLEKEGVDATFVRTTSEAPTGVALIEVADSGENRIAVVSGANALLDCDIVSAAREPIAQSAVCLFQLETALPSVNHAAALARRAGAVVVLDPAPAQPVPEALLTLCDYVTPNETELSILSSLPTGTMDQALDAAWEVLKKGARAVVNKRGAEGALLVTRDGAELVRGYAVDAVDTTAAGDSFNAGFAVALAHGKSVLEAIRFANAVGALSTTRLGAQPAMPTLDQALRLMGQREV